MVLSLLPAVSSFSSGLYQGQITPRHFKRISIELQRKFCQFRGPKLSSTDIFITMCSLCYLCLNPEPNSTIHASGLSLLKLFGCPVFLHDLTNLLPKTNLIKLSSNISLEFSMINNPVLQLGERFIRTGKFSSSLQRLKYFFELNNAQKLWKDEAVINMKKHPFEFTNTLIHNTNNTHTYYSQSKEYKHTYTHCFSFFFDFRILSSFNAFGSNLDLNNWNLYNNTKFNFVIPNKTLVYAQINELVEWYFSGNQNLSQEKTPGLPLFKSNSKHINVGSNNPKNTSSQNSTPSNTNSTPGAIKPSNTGNELNRPKQPITERDQNFSSFKIKDIVDMLKAFLHYLESSGYEHASIA